MSDPAPIQSPLLATVRQSVIGLRYHGPETLWGGKVSGSMFMDFWDGNTEGAAPPFRPLP